MSNEYFASLTPLKLNISGLIYAKEEKNAQAKAKKLLFIQKEPKCNIDDTIEDHIYEIMRIAPNICTTNNLTLAKLQCERLKERNCITIIRWLYNCYEYTVPSFSEYMIEFSAFTFAERKRSLNNFSIRKVSQDISGLRVTALYYALNPDEFAKLATKERKLDIIVQLTQSQWTGNSICQNC